MSYNGPPPYSGNKPPIVSPAPPTALYPYNDDEDDVLEEASEGFPWWMLFLLF